MRARPSTIKEQPEEMRQAAIQEGRKEVVDFIRLYFPMTINASLAWQVQLKEWGLK